MIHKVALNIVLQLVSQRDTRKVVHAGCAVTVIAVFLLLILPVLLLSIPLLYLGSYMTSGSMNSLIVAEEAKQQIAYVDSICKAIVGYQLDDWVQRSKDDLLYHGIADESISISLPPDEQRRLKPYEIVILWTVEFGEREVDNRIYDIADMFVKKEVIDESLMLSDGGTVRYGIVRATIRSIEEVMLLRDDLDVEQRSIAMLMLSVSRDNYQINNGDG